MLRMSKGEKVFQVFLIAFMFVLALIFILPFVVVLSTSFVSAEEAARRGSYILWPEEISLTAYKMFLSSGSNLWHAYGNTIFITVVGTFLNLLVTSMLAYGLSRKNLPGRNIFITMIFITMIFSGGLIPTYLVVKTLRLTNTIWAMIIPSLVGTWHFVLLKTFFQGIPDSLEESAMLDGATPWQILTRIVLPLSKPAIATVLILTFRSTWNAFLWPQLVLQDDRLWTWTLALKVLSEFETSQTVLLAGSVISIVPILIIYLVCQKYFIKSQVNAGFGGT